MEDTTDVYRIAVCSSLRTALDKYNKARLDQKSLQEISIYRRKVEDLCAILDKLDPMC